MDKLKLAHDYALEMAKQGIALKSCKELGWKYADAMQSEAEKHVSKDRPEALCEVDWRVAPSNAEFYLMRCGEAVWSNGFSTICPAPSFGFTGSHIVERPHGF